MASSGRARGGSGGSGSHNGDGSATANYASNSEDLRLHHVHMPDWQRGTRQLVLSSDYVVVEPSTKIEHIPSQLDFELPNKESFLFGPMCKFRIKGAFQKKEAAVGSEWTNLANTEKTKVLLAPNWLEMLMKEVSVFHNNLRVASSAENRFILPFVNAYLYHNMDPLAKKLLCPQPAHPGYCVPAPTGKWNKEAEAWKNYADAAFTGAAIGFDYTPLFLFPFYQGGSYMIDDNVPRILPAPAMGRLQIRFTFFDSQDHIFRKLEAGNTASYRFAFTEFNLVLEEARLAAAFEKQMNHIRRPIAFPGVTRIQMVESVTSGSTSWKVRFQDIYMPEGIFIFSLNKTVDNGTYKFSTDTGTSVFTAHNLASVNFSFDGKRFSVREPQLGTFRYDELDIKTMVDHLINPPFGVRQDPKGITVNTVAEGCSDTAYPHVYVPFLVGPNRQRFVPAQDDGGCINKRSVLDVDLKFTDSNAPANTIFVVFAIYTDVNIVFDPRNKHFSSPYLQYMN